MITDKSVREAIERLKAVETAWKITMGMFMDSRSHTKKEHRKDLTALTTAIAVMEEHLAKKALCDAAMKTMKHEIEGLGMYAYSYKNKKKSRKRAKK